LDATAFQDIAFSRNHGLLGIDEQDALARAVVAIPGLGGVGGQHLISLARSGFRRFRLADPDCFELANFNRQFGATVPSLGPQAGDHARGGHGHQSVPGNREFPEGVTEDNLEEFVRGADVVVDSLDFSRSPFAGGCSCALMPWVSRW
jgi:tRNA A37 threonylcarbamoyladenosine dehydratase